MEMGSTSLFCIHLSYTIIHEENTATIFRAHLKTFINHWEKEKTIKVGLEPTTSGSEVQRAIHCAT